MKPLTFLSVFLLSITISQAQSNLLYGLNFTTGQLRFASMDMGTGQVNLLSTVPLSADQFQQGVGDFDPVSKTFFYVRGAGSGAQIISVDAFSGTVTNSPVMSNSNGAVIPLTNIAYNWLNDTLYGLNHVYTGNEELKLASVDPVSGAVNIISQTPVSYTPYLSGNSDIDPIHRRYFYATSDRIYTVDLDDGSKLHDQPFIFSTFFNNPFLVNLTYNWMDGQLYCLFMSQDPNASGIFVSQLKLATVDPTTGFVTVLSSNVLSMDGFSMGDCDIDPVGNRYFYIRQNMLYTVELSTGNLLSVMPVSNPNGAIAPLTSIAYDDLAVVPNGPALMNMGDPIALEAGESVELDAWVGNNANYTWTGGHSGSALEVTSPGTYQVRIQKDDFEIQGQVEVLQGTATNLETEKEILQNFEFFPNPANTFLHYRWEGTEGLVSLSLFDMQNRLLGESDKPGYSGMLDVSALTSGVYYLRVSSEKGQAVQRILVN